MTEALLVVVCVLFAVVVALQLVAARRSKSPADSAAVERALEDARQAHERAERTLRDELARSREEAATAARQSREELGNALKNALDATHKQQVAAAQASDQRLGAAWATVEKRLGSMQQAMELSLNAQRGTIDARLQRIQEDNTKQLAEMRKTVDEKLQGTLEKRLGESFKQVSERLEAVYKGLGEMQQLAQGVGDLKRVLANVKTRGTWGEVQLGALLEEVLHHEQYDTNVPTKGGSERVEFAVRLPGRGEDRDEIVWLPIDAKFPLEDYQRLVDAQERGDQEGAESAGKDLEQSVRVSAAAISEKYLNPPKTTDFAILFLPVEGLFAEVIRRPGLAETIQRESRVVVAGPTTLWSILNSLQMGFRTLAIEQRSSEVWKILSAVKSEWAKYGDVLERVHKKLQQATDTIEDAQTRSRAIGRKLRDVQTLPVDDSQTMLPLDDSESAVSESAVVDEEEARPLAPPRRPPSA